jgi:hypothetical protein
LSARGYFESGGIALAGSYMSYVATAPILAAEATAMGAAGAAIGATALMIGGAAALSMIVMGGVVLTTGKSPLTNDQKAQFEAITNLYGQLAFTISAFITSKYDNAIFAAKTTKAVTDIFKFSSSGGALIDKGMATNALDFLLNLKDAQEGVGYLGTDFRKDFDKLLAESDFMSLFESSRPTSTEGSFPDRSDLGGRIRDAGVGDAEGDDGGESSGETDDGWF